MAQRAGLAEGWVAWDRDDHVAKLIAERTTYDDATRMTKLDDAVCKLEGFLLHGAPDRVWQTLGPLVAFDRLNAAYDALVQALFALNRRWRPWREREMSHVLRLPWLPSEFERRALTAINAPSQAYGGYHACATILNELFGDVLAELQREGFYGEDPIDDAFIRSHNEPGRAWNMAEWNVKRQARRHLR